MICPTCKREIPFPKTGTKDDRATKPDATTKPSQGRTPNPEDAVRADRPPAPCPQCGWSTMWNE